MSYKISPTECHPDSKGWTIESSDEPGQSITTVFDSPRDAATVITELHSRIFRAESKYAAANEKLQKIIEILEGD